MSPAAVIARYGVSRETLRRWNGEGRLAAVRMPGGKHLYRVADVECIFGVDESDRRRKRIGIVYARVNGSEHQRGDLERQKADLLAARPGYELVEDVGSGLNWNRRGLRSILERTYAGEVEEVVVAHRDRLARFGVEPVEWVFSKHGVSLVVLGEEDRTGADGDHTRELADDLLSVVTVFVAKHNGMRSAQNRRKRARLAAAAAEQEDEAGEAEEGRHAEGASRQSTQGAGVSEPEGEEGPALVDRGLAVDLQRMPTCSAKPRHQAGRRSPCGRTSSTRKRSRGWSRRE